jgi:hypothetical protein
MRGHPVDLEAMNFDGFSIKFKTVLVSQEFFHVLSLVALELDDLAHLIVVDDGSIAS